MINTQLKLEGNIHNGSKVVAFIRNYTNFLSFKAYLTLKVKVKVTSFQIHPRHLDDLNSFKCKGKIPNRSI